MKTIGYVHEPSEIRWLPVAGVQPAVYVAKTNGRPVAILELHPGTGFELTTLDGQKIGDYATLAEGESAFDKWVGNRSPDEPSTPESLRLHEDGSRRKPYQG